MHIDDFMHSSSSSDESGGVTKCVNYYFTAFSSFQSEFQLVSRSIGNMIGDRQSTKQDVRDVLLQSWVSDRSDSDTIAIRVVVPLLACRSGTV